MVCFLLLCSVLFCSAGMRLTILMAVGKTGEPVPVIDLPADAHEKLASLLKDLGVPQEFADEGDDEPTTSVSPSSPKPADANDDKVGENLPLVQKIGRAHV